GRAGRVAAGGRRVSLERGDPCPRCRDRAGSAARLGPRRAARRHAAARVRSPARPPRRPLELPRLARRGRRPRRARRRRTCGCRDPAVAAGSNTARGVNGPRVLIVEDDSELRGLLLRGLAEESLQASAVASGGELLERIELEKPDALVIDIGLPDA